MKRKTLAWVMGLIMIFSTCISAYAEPIQLHYDGELHTYDLPPITLYINDEAIETTVMPPIQLDNRVLVPAREVFTPMGANVEWKGYEKKAYISYGNTLLIVETNNKEVWVDGKTIELDVPAKIINDKIMLPIRFVSENLGFEVKWVGGQTPAVYVNEKEIKEEYIEDNEYIIEEPEEQVPDREEEVEIPDREEGIEVPDTTEEIEVPDDSVEEGESPLISKGLYIGTPNLVESIIPIGVHNQTQITKSEVIQQGATAFLTITASSEMSQGMITSSNGKMIIDIPNSINKLSASTIPAENAYIEKIRTSQFTTDATRVVLDLKSGAKVNASLSVDRKQLMLQLSAQSLEMIATGKDDRGDYVALKGIHPDQFIMKDDRLSKITTVTIPNAWLSEGFEWNDLEGAYLETLRAINAGRNTEITLILNPEQKYVHQLEYYEGETRIYLTKPTFKNLEYYLGQAGTIEIQKMSGLTINQIQVQDHYQQRKLVIDLGANYEEEIGYGVFPIDDEKVKQIEILHEQTTKLIVSETAVQTYTMREDEKYIYIDLVKPKEKYGKIVVLDPGHGGSDPGAAAFSIREKDLNLKEALLVQKLIEQNTDIKVYMTRHDDTTLTLSYRTEIANEIEADAFISFHNNAAGPAISGTEVYYFGTSTKGRQMAQMVQTNLVNATGAIDRKIKDGSGLFVIRTSNMPAILIETGFVTNYEEAIKLNSDAYNEKVGNAIFEAIVEMFHTLDLR